MGNVQVLNKPKEEQELVQEIELNNKNNKQEKLKDLQKLNKILSQLELIEFQSAQQLQTRYLQMFSKNQKKDLKVLSDSFINRANALIDNSYQQVQKVLKEEENNQNQILQSWQQFSQQNHTNSVNQLKDLQNKAWAGLSQDIDELYEMEFLLNSIQDQITHRNEYYQLNVLFRKLLYSFQLFYCQFAFESIKDIANTFVKSHIKTLISISTKQKVNYLHQELKFDHEMFDCSQEFKKNFKCTLTTHPDFFNLLKDFPITKNELKDTLVILEISNENKHELFTLLSYFLKNINNVISQNIQLLVVTDNYLNSGHKLFENYQQYFLGDQKKFYQPLNLNVVPMRLYRGMELSQLVNTLISWVIQQVQTGFHQQHKNIQIILPNYPYLAYLFESELKKKISKNCQIILQRIQDQQQNSVSTKNIYLITNNHDSILVKNVTLVIDTCFYQQNKNGIKEVFEGCDLRLIPRKSYERFYMLKNVQQIDVPYLVNYFSQNVSDLQDFERWKLQQCFKILDLKLLNENGETYKQDSWQLLTNTVQKEVSQEVIQILGFLMHFEVHKLSLFKKIVGLINFVQSKLKAFKSVNDFDILLELYNSRFSADDYYFQFNLDELSLERIKGKFIEDLKKKYLTNKPSNNQKNEIQIEKLNPHQKQEERIELLFRIFIDNLCIYNGSAERGYTLIKTKEVVKISKYSLHVYPQ